MKKALRTLLPKVIPMPILRRVEAIVRRERPLGLHRVLPTGVKLTIDDRSDWTIYTDIFGDLEYDIPIDAVLADVSQGQPIRVLDLGSNVGFFTLRLFDRARSVGLADDRLLVEAVEGSPINVKRLRQNLSESGIDLGSVRVHHALVGERTGSGHIIHYVDSGRSNALSGSTFASSVPYLDLSTVFDGEPVDLLKCDIEGSEELFLRTYPDLVARTKRAVFELHPDLCDVPLCKRVIEANGLRTIRSLRHGEGYEVVYATR